MKIVAIEAIALDIPFRISEPKVKHAGEVRKYFPMLLVRVRTDEKIIGWGEAFAFNLRDATRAALEHAVIPRCLGRDAIRISHLMSKIKRELRNCKNGPLTYAIAAVDIALWDIMAKAANLPLHRLLGGGVKVVPAYASLVPFGDGCLAAEAAAEVTALGYRGVKLHETAFEPIFAVREKIGSEVDLMVDASSAWSVPEAVRIGRRLRELDITWLEEPKWPPEDTQALARVGHGRRV